MCSVIRSCPTLCIIHSSVDGHLGCFHTLAIVNSTAMNIVHVSFKIGVFAFFYPGVEFLAYMAVLFRSWDDVAAAETCHMKFAGTTLEPREPGDAVKS